MTSHRDLPRTDQRTQPPSWTRCPPQQPGPYPWTQDQTPPSPGLSPKLASDLGQHGGAGCGGVCV